GGAATFRGVIIQILLLDLVFSLDSVITAVGMAEEIGVMIAAVVIAVTVMLFSARPISEFVNRHPTVKMLALSFLLLIGFSLVAEGWELHIPKGYIYFAMGFSVFVEGLNLRVRSRKVVAPPVEMRPTYIKEPAAAGAVGALPERPSAI
ncbi:MAG TPA: TerC family protein, partial [Acidimicrobiia bacterium]|nr:TerC family protein [Acidimicrobiia bacterium]